MPTYEYQCAACGLNFEQRQAMTEPPLTTCPQCHGELRRLISGGTGFIFKGAARDHLRSSQGACALERSGKTCCGRDERCGRPACGDSL